LPDLVLDGLRDFVKQTRASETRFKQFQNGVRLSPKPTPRSKRNKTRENHRKERHLQKRNNLTSMGNEASKRMGILDMPRHALRGHLKCKGHNNDDKGYFAQMGDIKKEPKTPKNLFFLFS
jgi:hypothetical protein